MSGADRELGQRLRRGDSDAFDDFYDRFAGPLFGYLRGMVQDSAASEDLLQETMLRVFRKIDRYEERGTFRAWVFRIATNLALSELRTRRRADSLSVASFLATEEGGAPPDAQRLLEIEEEGTLVREGLTRLNDNERAIILLRVREEMGIREIAETLCLPEGTVKSRIHHAIRKLRAYVHVRDRAERTTT